MISPTEAPKLVSLELRNVRGFENLTLDFGATRTLGDQHRSTAVVIGRNGTNKSTLLRSIAIGLASADDAATMLSFPLGSLVRSGADFAEIAVTVEVAGTQLRIFKKIESSSEGRDRLATADGTDAERLEFFVCGYGAGRGVTGSDSGRTYRLWDGVATLFDYRSTLLSPELTLRRLQDWLGEREHYSQTLRGIARLMGFDDHQNAISLSRGGGIEFSSTEVGTNIPLDGLADGYRVAFNWIIDLYGRAISRDWIAADGTVAGLVLIDEVDQHLHPELQTRVVSELERTFPHVSFILTTHSPLVALGCHPSQLIALERVKATVTARTRVPDFQAYSSDDMLSDERLFGTNAANPHYQILADRHETLSSIPSLNRTDAEDDELRAVAKEMTDAPRPSDSQFDLAEQRFKELLVTET